MKLDDIIKFDFVVFEYGYRYKISPRKATSEKVLNAVLQTLKSNGFTLYQLCIGGYIFAEKQK